jgi:hypothetical protein
MQVNRKIAAIAATVVVAAGIGTTVALTTDAGDLGSICWS